MLDSLYVEESFQNVFGIKLTIGDEESSLNSSRTLIGDRNSQPITNLLMRGQDDSL